MAIVNEVRRQEVKSVTLTLETEELRFLCTVLQRIGGNPDNSHRKYSAGLIEALTEAGVDVDDLALKDAVDHEMGRNSIYFRDHSIKR